MIDTNTRNWIWVVLLMLISVMMAARLLNGDLLFIDEYVSITAAGYDDGTPGPLGILQAKLESGPAGMGLLYHETLGGWMALVGTTPYSMRVFSLLFGLLALALTYRLGLEIFSGRVALFAVAFLSTSAFFVDYLHEARGYTQLIFFPTLVMYSYHRLIHRPNPHPVWYVGFSLALAATAYTHYAALAMGVVVGVVHLLYYQRNRHWWLVVLAMTIGGLLYLPWLGIFLETVRTGMEDSNRQINSMASSQIIPQTLLAFSHGNRGFLVLLLALAVPSWTRRSAILWVWVIVSIILMILINVLLPFVFHIRYMLLIWPALAILAALGVDYAGRKGIPVWLILFIWAGAGLYQNISADYMQNLFGQVYRAPAAGFHQALQMLDERGNEGDMALVHIAPPEFALFQYGVLDYYFDPRLREKQFRYDQFENMNRTTAKSDNQYMVDVLTALDGIEAVWGMVINDLPTTQFSNVVNYVLETQFYPCGVVFRHDDITVDLYVRPPQGDYTLAYQDSDDALIGLYDMGRSQQTAQSFDLVLLWQTNSIETGNYSVSLQLVDDNGTLVRQGEDFGLSERCTAFTFPLETVPPGTYALQAVVYDWRTGERLPIIGEANHLREVVIID